MDEREGRGDEGNRVKDVVQVLISHLHSESQVKKTHILVHGAHVVEYYNGYIQTT